MMHTWYQDCNSGYFNFPLMCFYAHIETKTQHRVYQKTLPFEKLEPVRGKKYLQKNNFISKLLLINFLLIDTTRFLCLRLYGADGCALMKRIKASEGFGRHPEKYSERRGTAARWRDGKRKDDGRVGAIGEEDRMEILATMECPYLCASVCVRNVYTAVIFLFCKGLFSEEYLSVHK